LRKGRKGKRKEDRSRGLPGCDAV